MGALSMIKKGTDKVITKIPENPSLNELQKLALYTTSHLFWRVLSMGLKISPKIGSKKHKYIEYIEYM